ncbi:hypothetical protein [Enhygromyxa salina]|uniref:hypothetical protein n=1 Tax=Enhygromyxa salina TaxID=215803 RepID=UPI000D094BF0|nr:hypothetical protein [Enhygromyxa salina]
MTLALWLPASACGLVGVEPEEIDFLDEGSDSGLGDETGDEGGAATQGSEGPEGEDDDAGTTDPGDGDGDGDSDGDSDSGQEDTGTGDGDGDGDGGLPCGELGVLPLSEGANDVSIPAAVSTLEAVCGAPGPEMVFSYEAEAAVSVEFSLTDATFDGVLYTVDGECAPLAEGDCVVPPELLIVDLAPGEIVYVVVDSAVDGGDATLNVTLI